jgi:glycosyltransferase involved in cell wall biosynthesis
MPAYNAERSIVESIKSVQNQTYSYWELLIIDDCSNDQTKVLAHSIQRSDSRIQLIALDKNAGVSNARNEGLKHAKGEWIAFLDSDDLWEKNKLHEQVSFHLARPGVEISHTNFKYIRGSLIFDRKFKVLTEFPWQKKGSIFPGICYKNTIGILTVMVARQVIEKVGFFDLSLQGTEDHDLWIRIAHTGARFGYLSNTLAYYRLSDSGISRRIGSYKVACKKLIRKCMVNYNLDSDKMWSSYYRYFGTVYFKGGNYSLAALYFLKSIRLNSFSFTSFTTTIYLIRTLIKQQF